MRSGPARSPARRLAAILVVALVALATVPGAGAAEPVRGVNDTIVVESDETVDSVRAVAGTVVIRGTVTGDVQVATGTLLITGVVEGDVNAGAGTVTIEGRVGGDVAVGAGTLTIADGATIGGGLEAGAGSVTLAGTVVGDAAVGAGSIALAPTATFRGDLRYDGELEDRGATVRGELIRDPSLGGGVTTPGFGVGGLVLWIYGILANLVLGVVLLLAFPARSRRLAASIVAEPLEMGLYGVVVLVGAPIVLLLVALTIIGIPLALVGALLFALVAWVAAVYGRFAVGEWLLGYTDIENRWLALLIGLLMVALLARVPVLGDVVEIVVVLLGLGALGAIGLDAYRARGRATAGTSGLSG